MSDFFEMVANFGKQSESRVIRMEIQKPRTHTENAEYFFDHNAVSCGEIIPRERKAQLSPVFEMPYGADKVADIKDAQHYS